MEEAFAKVSEIITSELKSVKEDDADQFVEKLANLEK